jgi:hypothetical protein
MLGANILIREFEQKDFEQSIALCETTKERFPISKVKYAVVAEEDERIVGFTTLTELQSIEPLAVDKSLSVTKQILIRIEMLKLINDYAKQRGMNELFFFTDDENLVKMLGKKYDIQPYSKEKLYIAKTR